jgi:hypothetical protein
MSWMDLSDYLVIEETAAARIDDLRDEGSSNAPVKSPVLRGPLFKWDVRKRVDEVIDYFGDGRPDIHPQSARDCW